MAGVGDVGVEIVVVRAVLVQRHKVKQIVPEYPVGMNIVL